MTILLNIPKLAGSPPGLHFLDEIAGAGKKLRVYEAQPDLPVLHHDKLMYLQNVKDTNHLSVVGHGDIHNYSSRSIAWFPAEIINQNQINKLKEEINLLNRQRIQATRANHFVEIAGDIYEFPPDLQVTLYKEPAPRKPKKSNLKSFTVGDKVVLPNGKIGTKCLNSYELKFKAFYDLASDITERQIKMHLTHAIHGNHWLSNVAKANAPRIHFLEQGEWINYASLALEEVNNYSLINSKNTNFQADFEKAVGRVWGSQHQVTITCKPKDYDDDDSNSWSFFKPADTIPVSSFQQMLDHADMDWFKCDVNGQSVPGKCRFISLPTREVELLFRVIMKVESRNFNAESEIRGVLNQDGLFHYKDIQCLGAQIIYE
jgi:hypothetical protein